MEMLFLCLRVSLHRKRNNQNHTVMEKNITLKQSRCTCPTSFSTVVKVVRNIINVPMEWFRNYYSAILEREVSMALTRQLLQAQVAFVLSVFACGCHFLLHVALCAWFGIAVLKCRRMLRK